MSEPQPSSLTARCPVCGARLSAGACPACALGQLLAGDPLAEEADAFPGTEQSAEEQEARAQQRYRIVRRLATGGMGVIFVAEDRQLRRTVALKMIRGSRFAHESEVARFTIEAEAAAALDHPHIVPIYEVGRMDGQPFFTMKLIEGRSLAAVLKEQDGMMPAKETATLLAKIARAVHHAHLRGVLHRDLKPENILLDEKGEPWLTDFGLAKREDEDSSLTLSNDRLGTPGYMSPEQAEGRARDVSTGSDVWALGVILWQMLSGSPPFYGEGSVETLRKIVEHEPTWPPGIRKEADLVTVARRCLEKNPAHRLDSAGEVADELERWLRGEPVVSRPIGARERLTKWARRQPALAALALVMAVAVPSGLFLWMRAESAVRSLTTSNDSLARALRISTATRLASESMVQADGNPAAGLLLAVAAVETTEKSPDGPLPEAWSALMGALQNAGGLDCSSNGSPEHIDDRYPQLGNRERHLASLSPDGKWLMVADYSVHEELWLALFPVDDQTTQPVRRWRALSLQQKLHGVDPADMEWLPDSRHFLVVTASGEVTIWAPLVPGPDGTAGGPPPSTRQQISDGGNVPNRRMIRRASPGHPTAVFSLSHSPDNEAEQWWSYAELQPDGQLRVEPLRRFPMARPDGRFADFVSGGWLVLYGEEEADAVQLLDLDNREAPTLHLAGPSFYPAVISPDGLHFVGRAGAQVMHYALPPGRMSPVPLEGSELYSPPGGPVRIVISPDSAWVATLGYDGDAGVQQLVPGSKPFLRKLPEGRGMALGFTPDGKWVAAGGTGRKVLVWRLAGLGGIEWPQTLRGLPRKTAGNSLNRPEMVGNRCSGGGCGDR